jgi:Spy/CpxP family protein refolding chaperone
MLTLRSLTSAAVLSAAALLSTTAANAAPSHLGGGRAGHGVATRLLNNPEIREAAQITDDQVAALEEKLDEARRAGIEDRAAAETARLDLEKAWRGEDAEAVHEAIDRLAAAQTESRHRLADLRLEAQSILSQEQRDAIRAAVRDRMETRRGEMQGRRPGPQGDDRVRERGPRGPRAEGFGPRGDGPTAGLGSAFGPENGSEFAFPGAPEFGPGPNHRPDADGLSFLFDAPSDLGHEPLGPPRRGPNPDNN